MKLKQRLFWMYNVNIQLLQFLDVNEEIYCFLKNDILNFGPFLTSRREVISIRYQICKQ